MTDHCIHSVAILAVPDANICCRCLQMATFESVVRSFNCMEEKYRVHDAKVWHDVWEVRKA